MNKRYLLLILIYPFFQGCLQHTSPVAGTGKNISSCILTGPESMTYYYGDSAKKEELKEGNIYDHIFMSYVLKSIKNHSKDTSFKVAIIPIASASVFENVTTVIDLFNTNGIKNRYIDTKDIPQQSVKYKLNLPADGDDSNRYYKNTVSLIVYGEDKLYAYEGNDINSGAKYNFENIDKYLLDEMKKFSGKQYIVAIKPTDDSNYKETVDILDKMKINKIEKYALVDVTDEENLFIKGLK